uniref:DUF19 domain-containing protein n=1 Tax=Steinernema glaseri TaxID=37863 RepID=A0A1I7YTX9_9BILA
MFSRPFLLILIAVTPYVYGQCNPVTLRNCYNAYLANYKLSTTRFPQYRLYDNAKENYLNRTGLGAQINICKWHRKFEECLGTTVYACINRATLSSKLGIFFHDATSYHTQFHIMSYQCGEGYKVATKHFFCMRSVPKLYIGELKACAETLGFAIDGQYECSYYNDFINCARRVYSNECGQEVSKYVCNVEKVLFSVNDHKCSSSLLRC